MTDLAAPDTLPRRKPRRDRTKPLRIALAVIAALVMVFPLYWMVVVAFSPRSELSTTDLRFWPRAFTLDNVTRIFDAFPVWTWFGNSVAIVTVTTLLTVVVDLLAGYAFAHLRVPGGSVVFVLLVGTLVLPVQTIMVALFGVVNDLGLYGTYWAVILPTSATAFGIFLARQFMLSIPAELLEAARVDGAGTMRVFVSIVLPLCKPLIAVLTLLTVLASWNDFSWPLIALKENRLFTLPIGLLYLQGQFGSDYGATMAFALLASIPMVVLFLLFQRWFVQGFASSGLK